MGGRTNGANWLREMGIASVRPEYQSAAYIPSEVLEDTSFTEGIRNVLVRRVLAYRL